jgi:hypothetical protein
MARNFWDWFGGIFGEKGQKKAKSETPSERLPSPPLNNQNTPLFVNTTTQTHLVQHPHESF